ncbi:conserved hypothetical protein [Heliomicrobium modesticaldum Ice1]|uniref:GGGtGRT protein n=1 Tax=Heliobacterium modesticaldum (strain ATCC 51547 / Ice1) TaxID=498761 RepID=B0TB35_HELMI|nr:GGGtGRT protein [Heliomicrobium modesticaldum]ABZ83762.1 conserved hypothetical protein [Heliomicrobium modesticaldum Ice1]
MRLFEGYERRESRIQAALAAASLADLQEAKGVCDEAGIHVEATLRNIQPIAFDNALWAYTLGVALALKGSVRNAIDAAIKIGEGLQAFTVPGSVADQRQVGIGHGRLAAMLLKEETRTFAFVAGHESFAAAEGALGVVKYANRARKAPLKVILVGLGKDAAHIIARMTGFTFVETAYDFKTATLEILGEKRYSKQERAAVKVYGTFSVDEGVAILQHESVDVSITGNSTNPVRFQHPCVGIYKKWCFEKGKPFFSVASGGGTGRTLHPDNVAAGPASYGLTDTMGRMHSDAQFAGSSSVPAHVDMMGFIGMGNNPIVGATVALAVMVDAALHGKDITR